MPYHNRSCRIIHAISYRIFSVCVATVFCSITTHMALVIVLPHANLHCIKHVTFFWHSLFILCCLMIRFVMTCWVYAYVDVNPIPARQLRATFYGNSNMLYFGMLCHAMCM